MYSPSKFFEGNLSIWTEDDVGVKVIFSSIFSCFLPSFLHCKSAKHDGFWGTSCGRSNYFTFLRSLPKIRNYRWTMRYLRSRTNCKLDVLIDMQRLWMMDAAGYSSKSTMFLLIFSMISLSASGGIHVWTKLLYGGIDIKRKYKMNVIDITYDARFSSGLPSRALSSWRSWYAALDGIPTLGMVYLGAPAASSSRLQDWCTIRREPWLECFLWMWSLLWSMTISASTEIEVTC